MDRATELENLRQGVLRLAPGSLAMTREDGVALIAELQETGLQIRLCETPWVRCWRRAGRDGTAPCPAGESSSPIWMMSPGGPVQ